jgi:hypothetical protein
MKIDRICAFGLIASVLAGCGGSSDSPGPIVRAAFGAERTYAIVSIDAHRLVRGDAPDTLTGIVGVLTSDDAAYLTSAAPVLRQSVPMIVNEFGRANSYRLMPAEQMLSHPAYTAMAADEKPDRRIVPEGYKYFENASRLGRLATALGVDGVAVVSVDYRFQFTGVSYSRLAAAGITVPEIIMEIVFHDRSGQVVWQDDITYVATDGPPSPHGDSANFDLLKPYLVEASTRTAESLSVVLDRRLGLLTASAR